MPGTMIKRCCGPGQEASRSHGLSHQELEEAQRHLWQSLSVLLMKGNAALLANSVPDEEHQDIYLHINLFSLVLH